MDFLKACIDGDDEKGQQWESDFVQGYERTHTNKLERRANSASNEDQASLEILSVPRPQPTHYY